MKVFIDGGGHNGCSIRKFNVIQADAKEYKKISFEPNEKFVKFYTNLDSELIQKAISTYNGICNFYMQTSWEAAGSSVLKAKSNLQKWKQIQVECIDLSKWIINTFNKNDYIILKLDIEGLEYDVLEKMIQDESITYIDKLYIEFHYPYLNIPNIKERHENLIKALTNFTVIEEWDALEYR
jgi:FkbM family methyltransferase